MIAAAILFTSVQAQERPPFTCLANDPAMLAEMHGNDPVEMQRMADAAEELEAWTREFAESHVPGQRNPYIIPVVFHIIHANGPENISDAQVYDAIRVLNQDFNKLNPDWPGVKEEFLDLVADVGIEFRLAKKDPQGNCTNGITRTESQLTFQGNQQMTSLIQWPRNRYMNVWVAASAGGENVAGYTNYPSSVNNTPARDGIVMRHNYVGSIGTSSVSGSRTLTHEVGHWINLPHVWGSTNNPGLATNCNSDDGVADTPNTIGWQNCIRTGTSCGSLDNVENYMDYSFCSKMFTLGQATRMLAALNSTLSQRNNLWQPANLALTGVDTPGSVCLADFLSSTQSVCSGTTINFTDISYHNVVNREWSFPGGSPASSSEASPSITYDVPGVYPVSLTVSDGSNSLTRTASSYITVLQNPGTEVPFEEGFESYSGLDEAPWTIVNSDADNTFSLTSTAAFTGQNSVRIENNSGMSGKKDELVSNTYDMSGVDGIRITFRYAFAQRNSGNQDRLRFYVSNNCGQTWSLRQQLRAETNLSTGGIVSGSFVPANADQWAFSDVNNVSTAFHTSDFRFKFEFESNGGNNLYIDDININGATVGVNEVLGSSGLLMVVPNPAKDEAQAIFRLGRSGAAYLELVDVLGRSSGTLYAGTLAAGEHRVDLPLSGLPGGFYFIRLVQGAEVRVVRFVVE
jgi:PKD repeat protein